MSCEQLGNCGANVAMDAQRVAQELQSPNLMHQALQDIRAEVYNLPPIEAERFAHALQRDTNGTSPLRAIQQTVQDSYGSNQPTGNELLVLSNPYSGNTEILKLVHPNPALYDQQQVPIQQPEAPPQYAPAPYSPAPYSPAPYAPAPYATAPYAPAPYSPAPYAPAPYAPVPPPYGQVPYGNPNPMAPLETGIGVAVGIGVLGAIIGRR